MDLVDEYSTVGKVSKEFWKAFNEEFKTGEEGEEKVDLLIKLGTMLDIGDISKEEIIEVVEGKRIVETKNE